MYRNIAKNKRNTVFIIILFVLIIGGLGLLAAYIYRDISIVIITLVVAIAYAVFQYFAASSQALTLSGARQITKDDNPRLYRIVENLSITTGTPMPKVYIINDPAPNAFATGRDPSTRPWRPPRASSSCSTTRSSRASWPTRSATCRTTTSASR